MIRLMFECPETGKPLAGAAIDDWTGEVADALIALHCPKCSGLHEFTRAQGIMMVAGMAPAVVATGG
ncbi:MAG TPA: hypothetical protein VN213_01010 [Solirubrobacteraceae bacterium]|nr:hypothetical protein [Solirubrobacteraceae bacterium]